MPDQAPLRKEPSEAFEEHLTLPKDAIQEIQAAASINTQANLQENKDNDPDAGMVKTQPPTA
jgi:hypothetical protein